MYKKINNNKKRRTQVLALFALTDLFVVHDVVNFLKKTNIAFTHKQKKETHL